MKKYDCPFCGSLESADRILRDELFEYKGHSKTFNGYVVFKCNECDEEYVEPGNNKHIEERIVDFMRSVDGLLLPREIRELRTSLKYSQEEFATLLGVGLKSFARYENGSVTQGRSMDNLLRIIKEYPKQALAVINRETHHDRYENVISISWDDSTSEPVTGTCFRRFGGEAILLTTGGMSIGADNADQRYKVA